MHVKNCERMPYKMYLARARVLNPTDCKDFPCDWCGSFFVNVRVRANHARNCLLRQKLAGMKPTRGRVINTTGNDAGLPSGFDWNGGVRTARRKAAREV